MKSQVKSLKISLFPKILVLNVRQFVRQLERSVSGDNLVLLFHYFMATASAGNKVNNINFERRDLTSAEKSHPSPDDFGETFAFNLIKENVSHFSFIF